MGTDLLLTHLARVECADQDIPNASRAVEHHLSLTLCIDLHRTPDTILAGFDATARKKVRRVERLGSRVTIRRYNREQPNGELIDDLSGCSTTNWSNTSVERFPHCRAPRC
jgi:hypothetical protein